MNLDAIYKLYRNKAAPTVVCPACGASAWAAHQIAFNSVAVLGALRVQPLVGSGLWPDDWQFLDQALSETYAWECLERDCGSIYADADLLRSMRIDEHPPERTSYDEAEIRWLRLRISRLLS